MREIVGYARKGHRLRAIAADRRSRLKLAYLGASTVLRSRGLLLRAPISCRVNLGGRTYPVSLRTQTEVDVLCEIGIADEYAPADRIPAETIVDLGGHVGIASLRLLATHPGARLLTVEADPELVPRLRRNLAGTSATVVHAAVCGSSGEREFFRSDVSSWGNSLDRTEPRQQSVRVPALSLDDLMAQHGIERVDLLKLDVEGAEWELFEDGVPDWIGAIVGEVHERDGRRPLNYLDRLRPEMEIEITWQGEGQLTFVASRAGGGVP